MRDAPPLRKWRRLAFIGSLLMGVVSRLLAVPSAQAAIHENSHQQASFRYLTLFEPAMKIPVKWKNGGISTCLPGSADVVSQLQTLITVNYFRTSAGLKPVNFTPSLNKKAQAAALLMSVNQNLTHDVPSHWRCAKQASSKAGVAAAKNSNLVLGASGPKAIELYMTDPGVTSVGHRRWVLSPKATNFGSGIVAGANVVDAHALYVVGAGTGNRSMPKDFWLPYPNAGFFPAELEPKGLWSLGVVDQSANFSNAKVTVKLGSSTLKVKKHRIENGFAVPTLAWQVSGVKKPSGDKVNTYNVTVSNIKTSSGTKKVSYSVRLFNPGASPTLKGTPAAGKVLRAQPSIHKLQNPREFYWLRNGKTIKGASGFTYRVQTADAGKTLSVQEHVKHPTSGKVVKKSTSPAHKVQLLTGLKNTTKPKVSGKAQVKKTLKASKGRWKNSPKKLTVQWYRNGKAIKGATKWKYKISKLDRKKRLRVQVTAKKAGYKTAKAWSSYTKKVK